MKKYDVIIVGAGVSGLYLAKLLDKTKLKVLLVEKRKDLKKLENHRYGTFGETVKKFKLEKYTFKDYKKGGFYSPNSGVCYSYKDKTFQMVDLRAFGADLKLNCDIITSYAPKRISRVEGEIKLDNKYSTKIIVDCSGYQKAVAKKLNLLKGDTVDMFCVTYETFNCQIPKDRVPEFWFMTDLNYSNTGMWVYMYSPTSCQFGIGDFFSAKRPLVKDPGKCLKLYLQRTEPYKKWFKNSHIKETVRKVGPTATVTAMHDDNFLACGDAAGAGTPLMAEGFRISLEMAKSASQTITKAFKNNDFSKQNLSLHKNNFDKEFGHFYFWSKLLRWTILNFFTNKEYDIFTKNLNNLTPKELYLSFKSEITFKMMLKVIRPKLIFYLIKNSFLRLFNKNLNTRIIK